MRRFMYSVTEGLWVEKHTFYDLFRCLIQGASPRYTCDVSFIDDFVEMTRERGLFPHPRNRLVLACSGGADSLFLMYLLWSCRDVLGLELSVLTCDHGLRPESRQETHEVQQKAWSLGLPCQVRYLNVPEHQYPNESLEMAARRLRRMAYVQAAVDFGAQQVALGHHMNDQAETVFLKLSRGTGPRGAGGMDWLSPLNEDVDLVRPLLGYPKETILEWVQRWGIEPCEDSSNSSNRFLRNRVRNEVIPVLEDRINPGVVQHVYEFTEQQRKLEAWVASEARERGRSCLVDDELLLEPWRFLPEVLRERVLMGWLQEQGADLSEISQKQFSKLVNAFMEIVPYARRWHAGGLAIRVDQDVLSQDEHLEPPQSKMLPLQGELFWESLHRPIQVSPADCVDMAASAFHDFQGPLTAFVRPPQDGDSFQIRPPQPGDRYSPLGLDGSVKLSDLFINQHLPAKYRPVWPVVVCGEDIVWVPGFRVADQWRVEKTPCIKMTLLIPDL
jgi:tRNA(Ile)-lysidine synthase